jgi:hypothetical protein
LSEEVICDLLRDFRLHGQKAVAQVRRKQPAAYLKVLALLVPREAKIEHANRVGELSDEALEAMIGELEERLVRKAAGLEAKVIEHVPEALPESADADTAVAPTMALTERPRAVRTGRGE